MGKSSTRAKNKYNRKTYKQINFRVKEELAERFRVACAEKSFSETLERLLDAADGGKLAEVEAEREKIWNEYEFLCGEWDKLVAKAKELLAENKKLRAELEEERGKGLLRLLKEKILGRNF